MGLFEDIHTALGNYVGDQLGAMRYAQTKSPTFLSNMYQN